MFIKENISKPATVEVVETTTTATKPTKVTSTGKVNQHSLDPNLLRREFKFAGQIGESGQKERLTLFSLANQIEMELEKGYPERHIVQGLIQAITPGLPLGSYLEGRS